MYVSLEWDVFLVYGRALTFSLRAGLLVHCVAMRAEGLWQQRLAAGSLCLCSLVINAVLHLLMHHTVILVVDLLHQHECFGCALYLCIVGILCLQRYRV